MRLRLLWISASRVVVCGEPTLQRWLFFFGGMLVEL